MIDAVMVFALGFLVASLIALLTLPALSRRAERLARRRVEAQFPMSLAEIAAERDHLRAGMAVETRKVEMKADAVFRGKAEDMAELGRRAAAIVRLEEEFAAKSAELASTHQSLTAVTADLAERTRDLEQTGAALEARTRALAERDDSLAALQADYAKVSHLSDERRISIAALETAAEGYRARNSELERALQSTQSMLADATKAQADMETKAAVLDHRLTAAEDAGRQREATLVELQRERDRLFDEVAQLKIEVEEGAAAISAEHLNKVEIETALDRLKADFDSITSDYATSLDHIRAEKAAATGALETARRDRDRLEKEVKSLNKRLKAGGQIEDAAILRQEIQRVGSEVLRLVAQGAPAAPVPLNQMRDKKRAAKAAPVASAVATMEPQTASKPI